MNNEHEILSCFRESIDQMNSIFDTKSYFDTIAFLKKFTSEKSNYIVFSGIGKSSYIAKKASSTMSSVGIKSFFINPVEATHGDLGVLTEQNAVIIISNSGNTTEIFPLLNYCNENNIKTISITSDSESYVSQNSTFQIIMPKTIEIFHPIPAPTISTTNALIFCDIISYILSKNINFDINSYQKIHPNGQIGFFTSKVEKYTHRENLPILDKNIKIKDSILKISLCGFGLALVCENNKLVGIVTDGDLRRHTLDENFLNLSISNIMTKNPVTINSDDNVVDVINIMKSKNILNVVSLKKDFSIDGIVKLYDLIT